MLKRLLTALSVLVSLALAPSASASTLVFSGTTLTGVDGLDVGGTLYDVQFVDGTCADVFSGCDSDTDFTFTTSISVLSAVQALIGAIGTTPAEDTFGCSETPCAANVPWGFGNSSTPSFVDVALAVNAVGTASDGTSVGSLGADPTSYTTVGNPFNVFATFTPSEAAPVPEPATISLLGLGLAGMAGRRWRQRKAS